MLLRDRLQRIAIARLLSDLIEADFVVEQKEMSFFETLISKDYFNITASMLVDAKKMDFAKAVSLLKELDRSKRVDLVNMLKMMAMSDGTCVPFEAIQIFAIEQSLLNDATVYSVPSLNFKIDKLTALYIENESYTKIDPIIDDNYRFLCNEFSMAGFNFVHIPHIVKDFTMMSPDYLRKVVMYMIPSITLEKVESICNNLRELTTLRFCRDFLYKKTGLNLLDTGPSLLIKINESVLVDPYSDDEAERRDYSNFLRINLNDDLLKRIPDLLDTYHAMISSDIVLYSKPKLSKFIYYGFHRSLFELVAYSKVQKDYRLVFNISNLPASVYFESLNDDCDRILLKLPPQEIALYAMIVKKSLTGEGLDWREHIPDKEKEQLLSEYNKIYSHIGKGNVLTEYKDRTQTNHIKNKLKVMQNIANLDVFIPEHVRIGGKSLYRIHASKSDIEFL